MKTWLPALLFVAVVVCLSGCSHNPDGSKGSGIKTPKTDDPLSKVVADLAEANQAPRIRDVLHRLDNHVITPERSKRIEEASAKQRGFLRDDILLAADAPENELDEVEAGVYSLLDAHYLDSCFLLRYPARDIEKTGLPPLQQAQIALDWVARQVILATPERETWAPPHIVLRNGFGNVHDRAQVFLALLRQLRIEGCEFEGQYPLVGVLAAGGSGDNLYLFDPGLGLAIPGPNGKGIATFADVNKDHKLLAAVGLPEDDLHQREISLYTPMSALAPRMMVLEDVLFDEQRTHRRPMEVVLYIGTPDEEHKKTIGDHLQKDIATVAKEIGELTKPAKVRIGNSTTRDTKDQLKNSATRSLRWHYTFDDGGRPGKLKTPERPRKDAKPTPRSEWSQEEAKEQIAEGMLGPIAYPLTLNLRKLQLLFEDRGQTPPPLPLAEMGQFARYHFEVDFGKRLMELENEVIELFVTQPREMLLRGQFEEMTRRVTRLSQVETFDFVADDLRRGPGPELLKWREMGFDAYKLKKANKARGDQMEYEFWMKDQLYHSLVTVNLEIDLNKLNPAQSPMPVQPGVVEVRPTMLTNVVFGVCKELLDQNSAYLQAERLHEVAVKQQAIADELRLRNKSTAAAELDAKIAWSDAVNGWKALESPVPLSDRITELRKRYEEGSKRFLPYVLPHILFDWSMSCSARINQATARINLARASQPIDERELKSARELLQNLDQELDAQLKDIDGKLKKSLEDFQKAYSPFESRFKNNVGEWDAEVPKAIADNANDAANNLRSGTILPIYRRLVQVRLKSI